MLRRLRLRRRWWAAVAVGLVAGPALLGGVAAAPADQWEGLVPEPELNPLETLPPDPAQIKADLVRREMARIADLAPEEFRPLVVEAAGKHQLDPRLLAAVITVESDWDPSVVGRHGEKGLMQVLPATGAWLARQAGLGECDLADPATSLDLGALYLSILLRDHGTAEKALAAYNGGPSAAESWQTNLYARRVLEHYRSAPPSPGRKALMAVAS